MTLDELRTYKKILLLGYGIEGKASERFLKKFHPEADIGIQNYDQPGYLENQEDYDLAIRTPFLSPSKITIPHTSATNLFMANVPNMKIGVTGTKGKSTTASLLHHVLKTGGQKARLYGNVGIPMLEALVNGIDPQDIFVLELSSYQLQDLHTAPEIACFLNIYEELHNHESYEEYFNAKSAITLMQTSKNFFFYNGEDEKIAELASQTKAQAIDFTKTEANFENLPFLTDRHNLQAVKAIAKYLRLSEEDIEKGLRSYMPLPHRLHTVGTYDSKTFVDDSASTHPSAAIFALSATKNVCTILIGGEDRGYDFSELAQALAEGNVSHIFLFPETEDKITEELKKLAGYNPHIERVHSMEHAVQKAFEMTKPGTVCLLSPGAPSYTMFNNFHERGDEFVRNIEKYAQTHSITQTRTETH